MSDPSAIPSPTVGRLAKAPFRRAVLVCGKCARKLDGQGFGRGGRQPLRKALKRALKGGAWGKVRLVETSCLKLCPKRRQALATPELMAKGRLLVVEPGTGAEAVLEMLLAAP